MKGLRIVLNDSIYIAGLLVLIMALLPDFFALFGNAINGYSEGGFLYSSFLVAMYFIMRFLWKQDADESGMQRHYSVFLVLFLVSSFTFNKALPIFSPLASWFAVTVVLSAINLLVLPYYILMNNNQKSLLSFFNGVSSLVFLYLMFYTLPYYGYAFAGILFMGLGLHLFVPLMIVRYQVKMQKQIAMGSSRSWKFFLAGSMAVVLFIVAFLVKWNAEVRNIDNTLTKSQQPGNIFPAWLTVAQKTKPGIVSKKMLEALRTNQSHENRWARGILDIDANENAIHDPLLLFTDWFLHPPRLSAEDAGKVLQAWSDNRHKSEEKL